MSKLRWSLADEDNQAALFSSESEVERRIGVGEFAGLEFLHVNAKKIINKTPGGNLPFGYTVNAYRGCSHACSYCFARPTHRYLNLNIADDFDRRIVVKINAVERLRAELSSPQWDGSAIAMGTNTDPYQRAEGKYRITRGLIEVLASRRNPFSILTKSSLITRDTDVLVDAARHTTVQCNFSIPTLDVDVWKATEPGAPHPEQRLKALSRLAASGLDCGVLVAPVIPGLSDGEDQVRRVVDRCVEAGASWVAASGLHLKAGMKEHWMEWLSRHYPDLVPVHAELYDGRAFLPKSRRQVISGLAKRRRGVTRPSPRPSPNQGNPAPAPAKPAPLTAPRATKNTQPPLF